MPPAVPLFQIEGLHARPAGVPDAPEILQGDRPRSCSRRGPRPDGAQRLRASPRWRRPSWPPPSTRSPPGASSSRATTSPPGTPRSAGKAGMFLAFQYPQQVQGVSVLNFLRQALSARKGIDLSMLELRLSIMEWMERLDMDPSFADRYLNEGFSGGEKKRNEILQMAILEPEIAILDETDSGLDIDALKVVAQGVQEVRRDRPELGVLAITHYQRLLDHLQPDVVHILIDGRIVDSGGPELAERLEREGYEAWRVNDRASTSPPSRRTSRSSSARCTEAASSTSTRPTPRRSPRAVLDAMEQLLRARPTPTCTAAPTSSPRRPPPALEGARAKVARFIGARDAREVVFTKNATEALNLVAKAWGRANLRAGDVVVLTELEHHANIVPWHQLHDELGIELRWIPVGPDGHLDLTDLDRLVDGARIVSLRRHVQRARHARSRSSGSSTAAHDAGAIAVVDASPVRAARGHRRPGLGRRLRRLHRPQDVRPHRHRRAVGHRGDPRRHAAVPRRRRDDPQRHQGGVHPQRAPLEVRGRHATDRRGHRSRRRRRLPDAASAWTPCGEHEVELTAYALRTLTERFGDDITHPRPVRARRSGAACCRFTFGDLHPHDLTQVFDEHGVCVRAGHHCAKPLMRVLGVGRHRPSLALRLQRRSRRRRPRRRHRRRRRRSSPTDLPVGSQPACLASKTCTERSSSTTTAPRGTGASCPSPPATRVEGFNPLCGDEIVVYVDVRRRRRRTTSASAGRAARSASRRPR